MSKPVTESQFWGARLQRALAEGMPHKAIWDIDLEIWNRVKCIHGQIIYRVLNPNRKVSVLDAGCGLGELYELMPPNVEYTGVDITSKFIQFAQSRYSKSGAKFFVGDLRKLNWDSRSFDLVICRGTEYMIKDNLGYEAWRQMETEMLRVGDRILLLNYTNPELFRIFEASPDPKEFAQLTIQEADSEGSWLHYRPGKDGTTELYDLFVHPNDRRKGIASRMIKAVMDESYGTVYSFTQVDNDPVHRLYEKLGFNLTRVPGFYRGVDSIMVHKTCMNEIGRGERT